MTPVLWWLHRYSLGTVNDAGFYPHTHVIAVFADTPTEADLSALYRHAAVVWHAVNPDSGDGVHLERCDPDRGGQRGLLRYVVYQAGHEWQNASAAQIETINWHLHGVALCWTAGDKSALDRPAPGGTPLYRVTIERARKRSGFPRGEVIVPVWTAEWSHRPRRRKRGGARFPVAGVAPFGRLHGR